MVEATSSGMDDPPMNVIARALSNTSIWITWEPPVLASEGKEIITYNVSYDVFQHNFNEISNLTNNTTIELENLKPGMQYFITVEALYNGVTCGSVQVNATTAVSKSLSISSLYDFQSIRSILAPDHVTNVSILDTSSTVTVNWAEVNEQTDFNISYRVFYQPESGPYDHLVSGDRRRRQLDQELIFRMDFMNPPGTLTNLNGSVTYSIQVAAIVRSKYSNYELIGNQSEPIEVNTSVGSKFSHTPRGNIYYL